MSTRGGGRRALSKSAIETFLADRLRRSQPQAGVRAVHIAVHVGATELGANWIPIGFDASTCERPKECQRHLMVIAQALAGECDAFPD